MSRYFIVFIGIVFSVSLLSCVKNEPFIQPYSVPATYDFENKDQSAPARVVMMHALYNYLGMAVTDSLSQDVVDSLWDNRGAPFTDSMAPDFTYTATMLNGMSTIDLAGATADADSVKAFADSAVAVSKSYNIAGGNGIAGWQTTAAPASVKYLYSSSGIDFSEVWLHAMMGAMAVRNMFNLLASTSTSAGDSWNQAYSYSGLPTVYDPSFDYNAAPLKAERPLGVSGLFAGPAKSISAGAKVYEAFRRGRSAIGSGDSRVSNMSRDSIRIYIEKTLAQTAVSLLDNVKQTADQAARLHSLSQVYGLVIALKYRSSTVLSGDDYWLLRDIMDINFYTLIQDAAYAKITEARNIIAAAYDL